MKLHGNPADGCSSRYGSSVIEAVIAIAILAWCILLLWSLLSCNSGPEITEGDVSGKRHEPERTWVQVVPVVMSTGKATTIMPIPIIHFDDEDWVVTIRGENEDGKLVTQEFFVSQVVYDAVSVGSYYVFDEDSAQSEDPVSKRRKD